jgi:hypothetical protein
MPPSVRISSLLCILALLAQPIAADRQTAAAQILPRLREGQHDFDFSFGTWKIHVRRLQHPLSGSTTWAEFNGTAFVRKIWNGRANLSEVEADGPSSHLEILALRLYNPQSHQWSVSFASANSGILSNPAIGQFEKGRGDFYDQEGFKGRSIWVRFSIWPVGPDSVHSEQAFSPDAGKTWEKNFDVTLTREKQAPPTSESQLAGEESADNHDFDFELGRWNIHLHKLLDPLTGSRQWVDFDGTSFTQKVWGGRAEIEQFETHGAAGRIEGLTLRLFDPQSHEWRLYWATSRSATISVPTIGEFKNGIGEFYDQEELKGRTVLVRFVWSKTDSTSPHFEQSFSDDGGKSWEANWITDQTRVRDGSQESK